MNARTAMPNETNCLNKVKTFELMVFASNAFSFVSLESLTGEAPTGFVAGELLISATTLGLTNVFGALCHGGE